MTMVRRNRSSRPRVVACPPDEPVVRGGDQPGCGLQTDGSGNRWVRMGCRIRPMQTPVGPEMPGATGLGSRLQAVAQPIARPGRRFYLFMVIMAVALIAGPYQRSEGMERESGRPLTARVAVRNGAPYLTINGKPVRGRMFFGGPGTSGLKVGPEGRRYSFEFAAEADSAGKGTLHLRFGNQPGQVYLDAIVIEDAETNQPLMPGMDFEAGERAFSDFWNVWPPEDRNTVGTVRTAPGGGEAGTVGLEVDIREPVAGSWPDFHLYTRPGLSLVQGHRYRVTLWCRSDTERDVYVALYRPGDTYIHLGGPPGRFDSEIKLAAASGVDFVTFIIPTPWPQPGEAPDWTGVDLECDRVLRNNPRAMLIPRIGLDPPEWWKQRYPDHMMVWENGTRSRTAVPASPLYRQHAVERLEALVRHLEERYGDQVAGYHPCGQNTGEWFYEETWGGLYNGYSPADRDTWRAWVRRKYGTDARLRSAWRRSDASLDAVEVPAPSERRTSTNGVLRNPAQEQALVDFADYQQEAMADLVCALAKATRKASSGRKLVVFFYGYGYEFGGVLLGPATSGHYAMRRVLQSPDIDILCSPISYGDRGLAETGPVMSAAESVALTGTKLWLQEDDTRTHESPNVTDAIARLSTPWETASVLTRNLANEATRNMATWWMDLGMTGWFDDPRIWEVMDQLRPLDAEFAAGRHPYRPEVASVIDERSMLLVGPNAQHVTGPAIYHARHALGRLGAPYGQYLLDDVTTGKVRARLYVFHNAWWLDETQRKRLLEKTRHATSLWLYAPGSTTDQGRSLDAMRQLTGFRLAPAPEGTHAWVEPTAAGRALGLTRGFGVKAPVQPLYSVTDASPEETLAVYADGTAAVTMRKQRGGISLFVGAPALTSELVRIGARAAGVHLFAVDDTCVWANGPVVAFQSVKDGTVAVRMPRRGRITDLVSGADLGAGPVITVPMRRGEVRILRSDRP